MSSERINEYVQLFAPHLKLANVENEVKETFELPRDVRLLVTSEKNDPNALAAKQYLKDRGLDERDLWFWKVCVSDQQKWFRRAIFPSFDVMGTVNFAVARAIDSSVKPKYQTPSIERRDIVFNELNVDWKKRVVLTEGVFDALKCGENAIPVLGSYLNERSVLFERIVMNATPVIVALDSDMLETATPRIVNKLKEYSIDTTFVKLPRKDPGEMSKDDVARVLEKPLSFDWYDFVMLKLNVATRTRLHA